MRWILILVIAMACFGFVLKTGEDGKASVSFGPGERVDYEMSLWGITVAKGAAEVDKKIYTKNGKPCFKVDAYMQTLGMATWVTKVNDNWGAYVDADEVITHESYRNLKEGKYRLNELIKYDHEQKKAYVHVADKATGKFGAPREYETPQNVRDVVAGFMYLRVIDFTKHKLRDTITVSGFFEDKAYSFNIIYFGKEIVKTDLGKILCYKLVPIMPSNSLFRGENSVTAWISADSNQIPIKVDAKMFVGSATTEIVSFRGLKHQFKVVP